MRLAWGPEEVHVWGPRELELARVIAERLEDRGNDAVRGTVVVCGPAPAALLELEDG